MIGPVVCSGGIDSTVLAYFLKQSGLLSELFLIDYGQAAFAIQHELVVYHSGILGVPVRVVPCQIPAAFRGRGELFTKDYDLGTVHDCTAWKEGGSEAYNIPLDAPYWKSLDPIPCRGVRWYVEIACLCDFLGFNVAYVGFQFERAFWDSTNSDEGQIDNGVAFLEGINYLFRFCCLKNPFSLKAPWLDLRYTKSDITTLGASLGVALEKTHSCERFPSCGKCHQCNSRRLSLLRLGYK